MTGVASPTTAGMRTDDKSQLIDNNQSAAWRWANWGDGAARPFAHETIPQSTLSGNIKVKADWELFAVAPDVLLKWGYVFSKPDIADFFNHGFLLTWSPTWNSESAFTVTLMGKRNVRIWKKITILGRRLQLHIQISLSKQPDSPPYQHNRSTIDMEIEDDCRACGETAISNARPAN